MKKLTQLILTAFILIIINGCKNENNKSDLSDAKNESIVDKENGFQDIKLGSDISKYRQRITYKDSITTSKDAMMYVITINKIAPLCVNDEKARVFTYKGKIMFISMTLYCPDIFVMFKNMYGMPQQELYNSCSWDGINVSLGIAKGEGTMKGNEVYEINYIEKNIQKEYDASKHGNL